MHILYLYAMNQVFLLLGSNLGAPLNQLRKARHEIEKKIGSIAIQSSIYESEAWGVLDQPLFYNQVICVSCSTSPIETLSILQNIEKTLGRVREIKWGARIIDIDILYFNQEIIESDRLTIPHPYIQDRRFTLVPLVEIAPQLMHPILGVTQQELLIRCPDNLKVKLQ